MEEIFSEAGFTILEEECVRIYVAVLIGNHFHKIFFA